MHSNDSLPDNKNMITPSRQKIPLCSHVAVASSAVGTNLAVKKVSLVTRWSEEMEKVQKRSLQQSGTYDMQSKFVTCE